MTALVPQRTIADPGKKPEAGAHPHGHTTWREAAGSLRPPSTHFLLNHRSFRLLETRGQLSAVDLNEMQKERILFQCERKASSDGEGEEQAKAQFHSVHCSK